MGDIDELKQQVSSERKTKIEDDQEEEKEDPDSLEGFESKGVISGFGKYGDAVLQARNVDKTIFVKSGSSDEFTTPNDVVKFEINQEFENYCHAHVHEIVEKNHESKNEMMSDIQKLWDVSDEGVNMGKKGNRCSFDKGAMRKLRNMVARSKHIEEERDYLRDKVENLKSKNQELKKQLKK